MDRDIEGITIDQGVYGLLISGVRYVGMSGSAGSRRARTVVCAASQSSAHSSVDERRRRRLPDRSARRRLHAVHVQLHADQRARVRRPFATTGPAVRAAVTGNASSSLDRALAEPAPAIAIVVDPQAVAAAQLGEVVLAVQPRGCPPAARHDVRPEDPHDRAVLEAREQPAVVADLARLAAAAAAAARAGGARAAARAAATASPARPAMSRSQPKLASGRWPSRSTARTTASSPSSARTRAIASLAARRSRRGFVREHRELLARRRDVIGPHAHRVDRRARRHAGQPQVDEANAARARRASARRA